MPGVWTSSGSSSPTSTSCSTSATQTSPQVAIIGLKFRAVLRIDEVSGCVALPCLHERQVGADPLFEHVLSTVECALLASGQFRANPVRV